ncbi:putative chromatin binding protein [Trypanosoma grayi]|uniref:putative chromatin binding protein n=1 Tax=Trypanosoma grayi TaxID=71804 RepID=UPI0004F42FA2|nr:putative chromatin binding protein [Trypanosoma grayi]KEG11438.1 putative chromatin binding protein [Trypanosoma grayi]
MEMTGPYVVLDAVPGADSFGDQTAAVLWRYLAEGDALVKVVHCAKHYGAALLQSGRLVLLAPESLKHQLHGTIIESGSGIVRDVDAGDTHIVFCTDDGTVFSFGYSNKYGQLGDGTVWMSLPSEAKKLSNNGEEEEGEGEEDDGLPRLSVPHMINGFGLGKDGSDEGDIVEGKRQCVPVIAVACGAHHTLLLTNQRNCVYGCGLGAEGQLGGKRRPLLQPSFKSIRLLFGLPIKQVSAAGRHSFVLLQTGKLLAFGDNTCGQLGLGSTQAVGTPTTVVFRTPVDNEGKEDNDERFRALDSYALKGLRASWGTAESMYFPLRVERISPELDSNEPFIVSVWSCASRSVVLTDAMEWLTCGLPLSRNPCDFNKRPCQRMDRYGPLGRWIECEKDAAVFGKMRWSERLAASLDSAFSSFSEGREGMSASLDDIIGAIRVVCSNRTVAVLIPGGGEEKKALLFVQGEVCASTLVDQGQRSLLVPTLRADKLLQDHEVDDDSCEHYVGHSHALFASGLGCIVVM